MRLILNVSDLEKSVDFSRLGFERTDTGDSDGFASLRSKDFILDLMQGIIPQDMLLHLVFDDKPAVDAAVTGLVDRGLNPGPAGLENRGAYLEDPDGNGTYLSEP